MTAIDNKLKRKISILNRLMGIPKGQTYSLLKSRGKVSLMTPNDKVKSGALTKDEMVRLLDTYVKGMEDYRDRVKIRKQITRSRS